jgi:hypothetical protein
MASPVAAPPESEATARGVRGKLIAFLANATATGLKADLERWNTPPPSGEFEVLDGLLIERGRPDSGFDGIELDTGVRLPAGRRGASRGAIFMLRDTADPEGVGLLYRARLVMTGASKWVLVDIQALCTGCLGAGFLEPPIRPCDSCDGVGWGLTDGATQIPR